jgi:hypothetical protein
MIVTAFFIVLSLVGSFYNATLRIRLSYVIYLVSNVYFCIHNIAIGERAQTVLFGTYTLTALIGLYNTRGDPSVP